MTEKALQAKVLKKLRAEFGGVWVNKSPSPWDSQGIADIIGCVRGRFIAIELKRPGLDAWKNMTDPQHRFCTKVLDNDGIFVAASSWEEVRRILAINLEHYTGTSGRAPGKRPRS